MRGAAALLLLALVAAEDGYVRTFVARLMDLLFVRSQLALWGGAAWMWPKCCKAGIEGDPNGLDLRYECCWRQYVIRDVNKQMRYAKLPSGTCKTKYLPVVLLTCFQ